MSDIKDNIFRRQISDIRQQTNGTAIDRSDFIYRPQDTGYGIFAENMLETAQSVANENKLKDAS